MNGLLGTPAISAEVAATPRFDGQASETGASALAGAADLTIEAADLAAGPRSAAARTDGATPNAASSRADVAVVGAGLAGLAAAVAAARTGRRVVVFEQAATLGGRARTRTEDGFTFNIGPHALYKGGLSLQVLRDLGVEPDVATVGLGGAKALLGGQLYDLPAGLGTLLTSPLLGWRARFELARFLGSLGSLDPRSLDGVTLTTWLARTFRTPIARQFVSASIRTAGYADDPDHLSAGAGLRQLKRGFSGALYVHGGWQTIVSALRARAEALGVHVVGGARVAEVEHDGAVRAVRLADGRRYEVGTAILAVPPTSASALVDGGQQADLRRWAEAAVPVRVASLDVGLRRLPRPDAWFAMGLDRPLYLSVHSNWARLAPAGGALIHVMRYLGTSAPRGADDERELEGLLDLMQPGWRDEVVTRRFMPNLVVAGALPSVAWEQGTGPAGPAVAGVTGLFVAGDWVGPDGMLADRALVSGARAGVAAAAVPAAASLVTGGGR